MMNKVTKGEFGYIQFCKKRGIIRTGLFLALTLICFFIGLIITHTQKNLLSIVAALLCLPTGWFAVNMVMFLKAKGCNSQDYDKIEENKGQLLINYDLVITAYDQNFNVNAATVLDKNICCYSSDPSMESGDCEKHINKMIAQSGYTDYSIKVFDNIDRYVERLRTLDKLRSDKNIDPQAIEDNWEQGTVQTPTGILLSISL